MGRVRIWHYSKKWKDAPAETHDERFTLSKKDGNRMSILVFTISDTCTHIQQALNRVISDRQDVFQWKKFLAQRKTHRMSEALAFS